MKTIRNSKTAIAARFASRSTGKIWVKFTRLPHTCIPGLRNCRPIICDDGTVGVRQYNGLWRLAAKVSSNKGLGKRANGSRYRDGLAFEAVHVLWFDEEGKKTDKQAQYALALHAYANRSSQLASEI